MLDDPEAGEMAAWALGRIDGGRDALISCLAQRCPTSRAAARALSGPAAFKQPAMEALIAALSGAAADEAAFSLGVLARNKDAKFPPEAYAALVNAPRLPASTNGKAYSLPPPGVAYALSRMPRGAWDCNQSVVFMPQRKDIQLLSEKTRYTRRRMPDGRVAG